ncbi:MAG: YgcG family protein [Betaproteobacteria bacterium]|nr:YgcG family protein [Betaproteobacteria bacterium]
MWAGLFTLALCGLLSPAAWAQVPVPPLKARVTDLTGTLDSSRRNALESRLADFERQKGAQIAVLLVPSVRPESIEQYGIRVAEAWKLGRKGVDDGLILLVAKNDREVRIEVGYGLEGTVPDAVAKRIIEEDIVPRFRSGDMVGGIDAGVGRLMAVVSGEPLPPPAPRASAGSGAAGEQLFPLLLIAVVVGAMLRAVLGRLMAAGASGGVAALAAGFMGASLLGIAGVGIGVFLFVLLGNSGGLGGLAGPGGRGGGWSSGGGFSGSGGGFGGGGASGRW